MAPKKMARVLLRLLTRPTGRAEILDEDGYVVLTQLTGEEWRKTFMEWFRDEISPFAPAKEARLSFQREMYFSLFSHGDSRFYSNLVSLIENLKAENGQGISLDSVTSGHAAMFRTLTPSYLTMPTSIIRGPTINADEPETNWVSNLLPNGAPASKTPLEGRRIGSVSVR